MLNKNNIYNLSSNIYFMIKLYIFNENKNSFDLSKININNI
jgi:hypothetical protein